jgi:orotidine-5'-phosphate decarboxylase
MDNGASLVQIYTGLVYRGPGLIRDTVTAIGARSRPHPARTVTEQRADEPVAPAQERTSMESFGERLVRLVDERGPLCVGIDPHPGLLTAWGLPVTPTGLARFCETVVEALGAYVPVLKPQSAFFELFGSAGIAVLESTIRQSRERGALVLLDVKRGDIGSTASAYASAYLDHDSPLYCDAVTVSPYPGFGALTPFLDAAAAGGGGVFVLAATSNPDGRDLQLARCDSGKTVAQSVVDAVAARNDGARPLGSVGVVVGVTAGEVGVDLAGLNGPVLAPGLGAQGGRPEDLAEVFARVGGLVLPSSSREILVQGPDLAVLREAARRTTEACRAALKSV